MQEATVSHKRARHLCSWSRSAVLWNLFGHNRAQMQRNSCGQWQTKTTASWCVRLQLDVCKRALLCVWATPDMPLQHECGSSKAKRVMAEGLHTCAQREKGGCLLVAKQRQRSSARGRRKRNGFKITVEPQCRTVESVRTQPDTEATKVSWLMAKRRLRGV